MLKKQYTKNINELKGKNSVVIITSKKHLEETINFYQKCSSKIRGIQIKASELQRASKLQDSKINYISIILDQEIDILKYKPQNSFIELIIPQDKYSNKINLNGVKRVIIDYQKEQPDIIADLISKRFFPFTKGIPFCYGNINLKYELFRQEKITNECPTCKLNKYCNRNGFKAKPILNPKQELLDFLENENTTNRI